MYETRRQAEEALDQLKAATTHSIWKSATYIEPARWAYDVVTADGFIIPTVKSPRNSTCIPTQLATAGSDSSTD